MDHTLDVSDDRNPHNPSSNYRYVVLGVLMLVYAFSFLDRQIVSILATSIKADLQLTDSQLGLVGGFAFAVFYTVLGIPAARLSDYFPPHQRGRDAYRIDGIVQIPSIRGRQMYASTSQITLG